MDTPPRAALARNLDSLQEGYCFEQEPVNITLEKRIVDGGAVDGIQNDKPL
jgi:hypothetical protein